MVEIQLLGPDVASADNQWPHLPVPRNFRVYFKETRMGEMLDFPPETYFLVPTGTGRYYRPMMVFGAFPVMWSHETREFLMQENLRHLYGSPLANCLTVSAMPDPEYEARKAAAREAAARRAASRQATNRRALERALERRALEQATAEKPVAAASFAPAPPTPAPPASAPLFPNPLPPTPPASPTTAPAPPAPVAAALGVPAFVAPAGVAPNNHHQAGNGEPLEGSGAWWRLYVPDEVVDGWEQEEAERQRSQS